MKLSTKQQKGVLQVHDAYWTEYLKGNVKAMEALLDDSYTQVGSAESEVFSNKKEAVQFLYETIDEVAGKLEMRNRNTRLEQQDGVVLVHERCDLYALDGDKWIFYSRFRATTFLQERKTGWKFIHQHSSFPDSKTEEGQNVAIDRIAEENRELREAVKRRTTELEQTNRELEIEAALEKVRSRTMAMQSSGELPEAANLLFLEILALGIPAWSCGYNILADDKKSATCWMSSEGALQKPFTLRLFGEASFEEMGDFLRSKDTFLVQELAGKALIEHYDHMKSFPDLLPTFEDLEAKGLSLPTFQINHLCKFSQGFLLFITYEPVPEAHDIFKRFNSVFEQTYTRFLDLQKAEAQAREAQIEVALERVRARTMAMQRSEELSITNTLVVEQINLLINSLYAVGIHRCRSDKPISDAWIGDPVEGQMPYLVFDHSRDPFSKRIYREWKNGNPFHYETLEGKDLDVHFRFMATQIPNRETFDPKIYPSKLTYHLANFSKGFLIFVTTEECPQEHDIFKRFAKVFEQTYTRFLDIQKAEAQAREAQIEAALERVRSRSMAMHKSEELAELSLELVKQVQALGVATWFCAFNIYDDDPEGSLEWGSNGQGTFPKYRTPREGVFLRYYEAGKRGETLLINEIGEDECPAHYEYLCTLPGVGEQLLKMKDAGIPFPASQIDHVAYFKYGYVLFITYEPTPESHEIFIRFANVFEQTYTRFLDLQKAEAQAREAQIEAAMERIRSRAIAMRSSDELLEVALEIRIQTDLLGQQDLELSVVHLYEKDAPYFESMAAMRNPGSEGEITTHRMKFPVDATPKIEQMMNNYWAGLSQYTIELDLKAREAWQQVLQRTVPEIFDKRLQFDEEAIANDIKEYWNFADFSGGSLLTVTYSPPTKETQELFRRASDVFDLAYKRYKDLQKAEAQAREAEIEAALERVRSKTMAMHKSVELSDTAQVLYEQFSELGNIPDRMSIGIFKEETQEIELWPTDQSGSLLAQKFTGSLGKSTIITKMHKAWKAGNDSLVVDLSGQKLKVWLQFIREEVGLLVDDSHIKGRRVQQAAFFSHGMLLLTTNEPVTEEIMQLLVRFAKVFSQTYTRFLDLQKAEAQAREAEIEAALERVRSKTMAMHNSQDVGDTVFTLFNEVLKLELDDSIRCGIGILEGTEKMETWSANATHGGEVDLVVGMLDMSIHPMLAGLKKAWKSGKKGYAYEFKDGDVRTYYSRLNKEPEYPFNADLDALPEKVYHNSFFYSAGILFAFTENPISEEASKILERFAGVFGQTYRRYLDLQKAESQAREAIKQASIDRVRGEIASMRSTADLQRITPLVWNELTTLEIPFIRCGVFIIDESDKTVQAFLSAPDGHSLGAMRIPFDADKDTAASIAHWKKKEVYRTHWDKSQFLEFMQLMIDLGQVSNKSEYQGAEQPPESLHLHFVPFTQGMLYVGNEESLEGDQIELVQSLADSFAIAYARYEDFVRLEKAKKQVENTLEELKSTQNQLVQSEKMASLGELTAGIAHEIQNPLNFVNNFSEVSVELLEELQEEMKKGDVEEVNALIEDIQQNLDKINHHGQRADGIVKGMLQHSRAGSGEKELTDLNVLADEYLRLAYHGLRAKDKTFNANMETHFDEGLGKVNVVPQDIGRVILNLITNAFYVVKEKGEQQPEGYEPTVTVTTKKKKDKVLLSVKDNGNGIPKKIQDKIFQPFFTTKPTGEGTGLGLSMSYDIVTKGHGGEIEVETKEGQGTEFTIELPVK